MLWLEWAIRRCKSCDKVSMSAPAAPSATIAVGAAFLLALPPLAQQGLATKNSEAITKTLQERNIALSTSQFGTFGGCLNDHGHGHDQRLIIPRGSNRRVQI